MKEDRVRVQQAFVKAGEMSSAKMTHFKHIYYHEMPQWLGPIDLDIRTLIHGMAQCVSGVLHWSYETNRYFGSHGLDIKRTRQLKLLPKRKSSSQRILNGRI